MKKRLLAIAMTLAMTLSLLPVTALAEGETITGETTSLQEGTYTLSDDVTLSGKLTVPADVTATIDLNGQTLTATKGIAISGTLTIKDSSSAGKLTGGTDVVTINSGAALTLESGTVEATGKTAIKLAYNSTVKFTMTGGIVKGTGNTINAMMGTVTITGGRVETSSTATSSYAIYNNYGKTSITIGAEEGDDSSVYITSIQGKEGAQLTINSGTVGRIGVAINSEDILNGRFEQNLNSLLPAGKICESFTTDDGEFFRVTDLTDETKAGAKINDTLYASASGAAVEMKTGDTLVLLNDCKSDASKAVEITVENATVDLNGHNIINTKDNGYGIYVITKAATSFTLKNSVNQASSISSGNAALYTSTNESRKIVTINVQGNISLNASNAEAIELGYAKLAYSEDAAALVGNGGFKANESDGEYIYGTAAAAIKASTDNTATLLNDYTGNDRLALATENATGIIDLNGHTFTSSATDAITANAKGVNLTVKNGKVISTSKGSGKNWPAGAAINYGSGYYDNASITLDKVQLSVQNPGYGVVVSGNNTNNSITLKNSTITVPDTGVGIYFPPKSGTLTIENSNVTGGTAVIVKGGTADIGGNSVIHATGAKVVPTEPVSSGANNTGDAVYLEGNYERATAINITGGAFTSDNGYAVQMLFAEDAEDKTISISGGSFSSDPSAYVTEDYIALVENGQYVVQGRGENVQPAEVVAGTPDTTVSGVDQEDVEKVEDAVNGIQAEGLTGEANTEANDNTVTADAGAAAINADKDIEGEDVEASAVTIVVQPYLEIKVTGYKTSEDTDTPNTMTLDITPMVRTVATTAKVSPDAPDAIKLEGEGKNAVIMEAGKKLDVSTPITLTIPLPDGFVSNATDEVFVQHKGYEYNTTVTSDEDDGFIATFTNPHGFSTFTISTKSQTVATVNGDNYTSFQDAVDAVSNNGTITIPSGASVPEGGLSATISGADSKSVKVENKTNASITVTINGEAKTIGNGGTADFTYTYTPTQGGSGSTRYTVSVPDDVEGGTIKVSPSRASRGQTVTITVDPDEGYVLDRLVVRDADGDRIDVEQKSSTRFTFEMPRGAVTIEAAFVEGEEESVLPFRDVDVDDWSYNAVVYVTDAGIMSGVSETEFAPNATLTRAMIAQMLWALEDKPVVNYLMTYDDVAAGAWYGEAVRWISSQGFMSGYSDAAFGPNDPLTREQLCLILYNYAEWAGYDVSGGVSLGSYLDAGDASAWAVEALEWALDAGLISGRGEDLLAPAGTATRAEIAQIMMNFLEKVAG